MPSPMFLIETLVLSLRKYYDYERILLSHGLTAKLQYVDYKKKSSICVMHFQAYYNSVKTKLQITPISGPPPELRCRKLPLLAEKVLRVDGLNPKDGNTVVTNYYQVWDRIV